MDNSQESIWDAYIHLNNLKDNFVGFQKRFDSSDVYFEERFINLGPNFN